MLKSLLGIWLLAVLTAAQFPHTTKTRVGKDGRTSTLVDGLLIGVSPATATPSTETGAATAAAVTPTNAPQASASSAAGQTSDPNGRGGTGHQSDDTANAHTGASLSQTASSTVSNTRPTRPAAQSGQSPSSSPSASQPSPPGGMTNQEKMGIGIGVGVGVPLIAGAIALFFLLGRRRRNKYGSERSAEQYRDQPGMASGAPALAGMSEMGRSPSKHSLPRTPSQHSLVEFPSAAPEPKIMPPSQHSFTIERAPTQYSVTPSLPEQQSFMSPPPAYEYDDAPSPMEEHPDPVSPVSPVSSMGSRPPSFINDHHHDR